MLSRETVSSPDTPRLVTLSTNQTGTRDIFSSDKVNTHKVHTNTAIITTTDNYTTLPDKYIITSEFTIKLIGLFLFVFILIFRMVSYFTGLDCIVVIYRRCVSQRQGSSPY